MSIELTLEQKQEIINSEIESMKVQIFEHRINIAKWQVATEDYSSQIATTETTIADLIAAIEALQELI
jgi:hypothetical protein